MLGTALFLLVAPTPVGGFDSESWRPGPGFTIDEEITRPAVVEQLTDEPIHGPEDIAMDADGAFHTGDRDGTIWRIESDGSSEIFAQVGGRPLGLAFAPDGRLIVANHGLGLQAVDPAGQVEVLADTVAGSPVLFANDLDIGPEGVV